MPLCCIFAQYRAKCYRLITHDMVNDTALQGIEIVEVCEGTGINLF